MRQAEKKRKRKKIQRWYCRGRSVPRAARARASPPGRGTSKGKGDGTIDVENTLITTEDLRKVPFVYRRNVGYMFDAVNTVKRSGFASSRDFKRFYFKNDLILRKL